jgi:hypothetical protein
MDDPALFSRLRVHIREEPPWKPVTGNPDGVVQNPPRRRDSVVVDVDRGLQRAVEVEAKLSGIRVKSSSFLTGVGGSAGPLHLASATTTFKWSKTDRARRTLHVAVVRTRPRRQEARAQQGENRCRS